MDLTQLFKASVKTVRLRSKSLTYNDKTRILKVRTRQEFSIKANDIRYQITQLRDLLIENRSAYMRFGIHLKSKIQMTDDERNIIDEESEKIILLCNQYLNDLKVDCFKNRTHYKKQVFDHQLVILDILSLYLKDVFHIHNEQKESRVQHELESYKLLKLKSNAKKSSCDGVYKHHNESFEETSVTQNNEQDTNCFPEKPLFFNHAKALNTSQSDVAVNEDQSEKCAIEYDNVSSDDVQLLESENVQMLLELKGLSEEVEQIEQNVVGIARLQEIFTEKVTVQKYDIERIGNAVFGATENIKDANEQIKQAIQRNAGLRVWILFFLIVMSFTLLFLDWYND